MGPRVLFVSKPIAPPWHDGSKNLVRDIARNLTQARPTVLSVPGAPPVGPRVEIEPIYRDVGRFAPAALANALVLRRLLFGDPHDVWHFVFAPNAASSSAARLAIAARRATGWRGGVVQTIASAPRSFEGVTPWIFGDVVVALSEWTRGRLLGAGVDADVRVVPPCAAAPRAVSEDERRAVRAALGLGDRPVVLYPGDYEISGGARTVARAVAAIVGAVPDARVVFACRPKTSRAAAARSAIERDLASAGLRDRTLHVGEVADMHALVAASDVVVFPVDDLYGKVDVPLVLLETLALGVPIVAARGGPLETLTSARFVEPDDDAALAAQVALLLGADGADGAAADAAAAGRRLHAACFSPDVVGAAHDVLYAELTGQAPPRRASRRS